MGMRHVLVLLLHCVAQYGLCKAECMDGWEEFAGSCYLFVRDYKTYDEAKSACENQGAHMVSISNKAENGFIRSRLTSERTWIGLRKASDTCADDDGECRLQGWSWSDGTIYNHRAYHGWDVIYYPRSSYQCAVIERSSSGWRDSACEQGYTYYYVCEKSAAAGCDGDWKQYKDRCYLYLSPRLSFYDARVACRQLGADLVSLSGEDEYNYIRNMIGGQGYKVLIGLRKSSSARECVTNSPPVELADCRRSDWEWVDGTTYQYPAWHHWDIAVREPNSQELCASVKANGVWNGGNCIYNELSYICKTVSSNSTSTSVATPTPTTTPKSQPPTTTTMQPTPLPPTSSPTTVAPPSPSAATTTSSDIVPNNDSGGQTSGNADPFSRLILIVFGSVLGVMAIIIIVLLVLMSVVWKRTQVRQQPNRYFNPDPSSQEDGYTTLANPNPAAPAPHGRSNTAASTPTSIYHVGASGGLVAQPEYENGSEEGYVNPTGRSNSHVYESPP